MTKQEFKALFAECFDLYIERRGSNGMFAEVAIVDKDTEDRVMFDYLDLSDMLLTGNE